MDSRSRSTGEQARAVRALLEPVFDDRLLCESIPDRYSRDYSIFRAAPLALARAHDEADVIAATRAASELRLPLVARCGASNTGGAAITDGILLDTSECLSEIRVDPQRRLATVGPGVRHDRLQSALAEHGLWLPSDPSSGPLSYLGGNLATRASGPHALRHGAINRYLRDVRIVLADGSVADTRDAESKAGHGSGGALARGITDELGSLGRRIAERPEIARRLEARRGFKWAAGYELLSLADHVENATGALPRLVCGSVGTLGIVTEAVLAVEERPVARSAVLLRFRTTREACEAATHLSHDASAVEIVSRSALELLRRHSDTLGGDEESAALLIVEYSGTNDAVADRADEMSADAARRWKLTSKPEVARSDEEIDAIWRARKALLPVVRRHAGAAGVPYSVVNDVGVPPDALPVLIESAERIFATHDLTAPIYGHAGSGNLHLRPLFRPGDVATMREVALEIYELVTGLGGTITAEHGMGRLRAPFLELEWGAQIVGLMREVKSIFDPHGILNPGVMFPPKGHDFSKEGWSGYLVGP